MSYNVFDIANKVLAMATENSDTSELITNLKLQKLLYYLQGYQLAKFDEPLFDDEIEAWMYGPVVPCVYEKYREYERNGIQYNGKVIRLNSEEEEKLFYDVYNEYSRFSAFGLIELTHSETPWKSTKVGAGNVISKESMKKFFKTLL